MRLRPDGVLEFEEATADGGEALLALAKGGSDGLDAATLWVRRLTVEHVRKLVAISEDGGMPSQAVCMRSRPDELERLALLVRSADGRRRVLVRGYAVVALRVARTRACEGG